MTLMFAEGKAEFRGTDGKTVECEYELYTHGNTPSLAVINNGERIFIHFEDWNHFKSLAEGMERIVSRLDGIKK